MNTRKPIGLNALERQIDLGKIRQILHAFRGEGRTTVFTADVIREYAGHFLANTGMPAGSSFNANFGKILKRKTIVLDIQEVRAGASIRDDAGNRTSSSEWAI